MCQAAFCKFIVSIIFIRKPVSFDSSTFSLPLCNIKWMIFFKTMLLLFFVQIDTFLSQHTFFFFFILESVLTGETFHSLSAVLHGTQLSSICAFHTEYKFANEGIVRTVSKS